MSLPTGYMRVPRYHTSQGIGRAIRRARAAWLGKGMIWQTRWGATGKARLVIPFGRTCSPYKGLTVRCLLRPLKSSWPCFFWSEDVFFLVGRRPSLHWEQGLTAGTPRVCVPPHWSVLSPPALPCGIFYFHNAFDRDLRMHFVNIRYTWWRQKRYMVQTRGKKVAFNCCHCL